MKKIISLKCLFVGVGLFLPLLGVGPAIANENSGKDIKVSVENASIRRSSRNSDHRFFTQALVVRNEATGQILRHTETEKLAKCEDRLMTVLAVTVITRQGSKLPEPIRITSTSDRRLPVDEEVIAGSANERILNHVCSQ